MSTSYPITVKVTDAIGRTGTKNLSLLVYNQGVDGTTDAAVTVSSDFKTATSPDAANHPMWCAAPIVGKKYWETQIQAVLPDYSGAGIAEGSQPLGAYIGYYNYGCAIFAGDRKIYRNNAVLHDYVDRTLPAVEKFKHAFDSATRRYWVGLVGGAWFSGDPAAGTSPSTTMLAGTYYPAISLGDSGKYIIVLSDAADFEDAPPTGFSGF